MDNKYYQPKIEEFHVGFEYEIYEDFDYYTEKTWHKQFYGKNGTNHENMDYVHENYLDKIRVKYLDKQDIEDLGFEVLVLDSGTEYEWHYIKYNGKVICGWEPEETIKNIEIGAEWFTIKNKAEFKKIMEQIHIL